MIYQAVLALVFISLCGTAAQDNNRGEEKMKCYRNNDKSQPIRCVPEFVNAAFHRNVESNNTCGTPRSRYCVHTLSTGQGKRCDYCDSNVTTLSHPSVYITDIKDDKNYTWWQSDTLYRLAQNGVYNRKTGLTPVSLTLDLGKTFEVVSIRLRFRSLRPESMAIFKRTTSNPDEKWIPYQYYSRSCRETYGLEHDGNITKNNWQSPLCTAEYSKLVPIFGGEVLFRTLENRPGRDEIEKLKPLQEWIRAYSLRFQLDRLNTFGDDIFGDPNVLRSYYYAIIDVTVVGKCDCNGHASKCEPRDSIAGERQHTPLACVCEHFTDGVDCEKCLPSYNSKPWAKATSSNANPCEASSGPPLNIKVTTQSSSSILISWKTPEVERQNNVVTNFTVCLSHHKDGACFKEYVTKSYELLINKLSASTKYFVRVLATTRAGSGNYSQSQEALTNGPSSGPPLNIKVTTQSSSSILISWKAPEVVRQNDVVTNFTVCLSHHKYGVCFKEYVTKSYELLINNLSASTKYFVRVLATTRAGSGNYSQSQEALTNGRPLSNPIYRTPNTLLFLSQIPKENVSYYEVIAVYLSQNTAPIMSSNTYSHLPSYNEAKKSSQSIPYIAAVFNINDDRFQVFTLGDGEYYSKPRVKWVTSEVETYFNVPLKENGTYRVFQRFFKNKNDYYSSDWSPPAATSTLELPKKKDANESCKEFWKTKLLVVIAVVLVLNAVLICLVIYLTVRLRRSQTLTSDEVGDIYDDVNLSNNETPSTYEELNLDERGQDEHTYQSLKKIATA